MTDKKPLRQALKNLLEQEALTDQEMATLQKAGNSPFSLAAWFAGKQGLLTFASLATTVVLLVLIFNLHWLRSDWLHGDSHQLQTRIAEEVLANHLKIKTLDIETDSISELQGFFDRLDFLPHLSRQIEELGLTLMGGRYCTLQGVLAAQLRFKSPEGRTITYYQALYDASRFGAIPEIEQGDSPNTVRERGFEMTLWQEQGLVTVLAQVVD